MGTTPTFLSNISAPSLPFGRVVLPPEQVDPLGGTFPDTRLAEVNDFRYLRQLLNLDFTVSVSGTWSYDDGAGTTGSATFDVDLAGNAQTQQLFWTLFNYTGSLWPPIYIPSFGGLNFGTLPDSIGTYGTDPVYLQVGIPSPGDPFYPSRFVMCQNITPAHPLRFKLGAMIPFYLSIVNDTFSASLAIIAIHTGDIAAWTTGVDPTGYADIDAGTIFETHVPIKGWTKESHESPPDTSYTNDGTITALSMSTPPL